MARSNSQYQFMSDEHGIENSMAMPEMSHHFCGRGITAVDQEVYDLLREEYRERAEREQRITEKYRERAERVYPEPISFTSFFSYAAGHYMADYIMPEQPAPQKQKSFSPPPPKRAPVRVALNNAEMDNHDLKNFDPKDFDHFDCHEDEEIYEIADKIDHLEDRVEERLLNGHVLTMADCREMRNHGHRGETRPHTHIKSYPNEVRFLICVDGRTFRTQSVHFPLRRDAGVQGERNTRSPSHQRPQYFIVIPNCFGT